MSVTLSQDGRIVVSGEAVLDDAEPLLRLLVDNPGSPVALQDCQACHTAVIQVLLASGRPVIDQSGSKLLGLWIAPSLKA